MAPPIMSKIEVERRFWSLVSFPSGRDGCWLWGGRKTTNGYGVFRGGARRIMAHRYAYTVCTGEIPDGLDLDHVKDRGCTHRNCVNPDHLEPVTRSENCRRSESRLRSTERKLARTSCRRGHRYEDGNLASRSDGVRECLACARISRSERKRARRNQAQPTVAHSA